MRRGAAIGVVSLALAFGGSSCTYDFDGAFSGAGGQGGVDDPTTSATGGAGAVGGSGGGASMGGGMPSGEQCFNGSDDDGDELVDCADPDCRGAQCLAPAPEGWSGPSPLFVGEPDEAPSCPEGLATIAVDAGPLDAPAASCSPCSCSGPSGGSCGIGTTTVYDSAIQCSGGVEETITPSSPNDCVSFTVGDPSSQALADPVPVAVPGSCQPSGGTATVPPASFAQAAVLCEGARSEVGGGCGDEICVPAVVAPFMQLCIFTAGDVACPAELYTDKTLFHDGFDDGRDCSACTCGAASGQSCSGTTELHTGLGCGNLVNTVPHDGTSCESFDVSQPTASALFVPSGGGPSGGSCSAAGGEPKGSATPKDPITVCCLP